MLNRRHRLAASFLAISLLAATLFAVDSLASPSAAEARCDGVNNPVWSNFIWGYLRVSETPGAGTCNGNNTYTGVIKDERADGYCVEVRFKETGTSWVLPSGGSVCGAGNTSTFQWQDQNGNSYVYEKFCVWPVNDPGDPGTCGWGSTVGSYGVNHGF
jgi:hypothetical protein